MADGKTITIKLRSEPGHRAPLTVRLRGALKLILRRFGLRCVEIVEQDRRPAEERADTWPGLDKHVAAPLAGSANNPPAAPADATASPRAATEWGTDTLTTQPQ